MVVIIWSRLDHQSKQPLRGHQFPMFRHITKPFDARRFHGGVWIQAFGDGVGDDRLAPLSPPPTLRMVSPLTFGQGGAAIILGTRKSTANHEASPARLHPITCSCSRHISQAVFSEMLAEAAKDAGCWVRVLEAADHPILLPVPETLFLKCFILVIGY